MELFSLFATLSLEMSDFMSGVKQAKSQGEGLAGGLTKNVKASTIALGNLLGDFLKTTGRVTLEFGKTAVTTAAEVKAQKAQFAATFGEYQETANGLFKAIGADTNILSTRLQTVGTKAFSQFKGAGLDAADSLAAMDTYTRLAADAAAYYDISLEDADERLRSFLRGNTEAGDAIGLFTSESQRNTYALEQYGQKWTDLTEAQKQMLMLNVAEDIYAQSGALGQAAEEGHSWANVVANLQDAWRQTVAVLGEPIVDALTPVLESITTTLQDEQTQALVAALASDIGSLAEASFQGIIDLLEAIKTKGTPVHEALENIKMFISDIFTWVSENEGVVKAFLITAAILLAGVNFPLLLVAAGVLLLASNWKAVKDWAKESYDAVNTFLSITVPQWFNDQIQKIADWFYGIEEAVRSAIDAVKEFFGIDTGNGPLTVEEAQNLGYDHKKINMGIASGEIVPNAKGLNYVPYDNYITRLHKGETVLSAVRAEEYRNGQTSGFDMAEMRATIADAVREGMRGLAVNMDGRAVGDVVTETVSRNIAQQAWAGRY